VITLDGYAASHRAVAKLKTSGILPRRVRVRSCKYLNNVIEQDHRRIKQRIRPMLGFKRFETAAVTIRGIPVSRENQETTVQPQTTNRKSNHHSGNLGRGPGRLKPRKSFSQKTYIYRIFATRTLACRSNSNLITSGLDFSSPSIVWLSIFLCIQPTV
jgi:hypothetical protein